MTKRVVADEVNTFSYLMDYSDLVNAVVGAQTSVEVHPILPEGWEVSNAEVETTVAFNGAGTRALAVGVAGTVGAILTGLDVKGLGIKAPTVTKLRATAPTPIIATLTTATDNPTAGQLRITLFLVKVMKETD